MNQKEYQNQNSESSYAQDMWQEYMDSLEDTEEKQDGKISDQVEKDLINYAINKEQEKTRKRRRRRSTGLIVGLSVLAITMAVSIVGIVAVNRYTYSNTYSEPIEYTEDWEDEYTFDEDFYNAVGLDQAVFRLDGEELSLPVSLDVLESHGWTLSQGAFSQHVDTVGSEPVTFSLRQEGEQIGEIMLVSPTGEDVTLDEAMVVGLSLNYDNSWYYDFQLPGEIGLYDSSYFIEKALNNNGISWHKSGDNSGTEYVMTSQVDNGTSYNQYELTIEMQDDSVNRITMQLKQSE